MYYSEMSTAPNNHKKVTLSQIYKDNYVSNKAGIFHTEEINAEGPISESYYKFTSKGHYPIMYVNKFGRPAGSGWVPFTSLFYVSKDDLDKEHKSAFVEHGMMSP